MDTKGATVPILTIACTEPLHKTPVSLASVCWDYNILFELSWCFESTGRPIRANAKLISKRASIIFYSSIIYSSLFIHNFNKIDCTRKMEVTVTLYLLNYHRILVYSLLHIVIFLQAEKLNSGPFYPSSRYTGGIGQRWVASVLWSRYSINTFRQCMIRSGQ